MWITQGFFSKGRHMAALGATRVRGLWWVRSVIERFSVTMQEKRQRTAMAHGRPLVGSICDRTLFRHHAGKADRPALCADCSALHGQKAFDR